MKYKKMFYLVIFIFVLVSCTKPTNDNQHSTKPDESYEQCLDPLFDSSFPVGDDAFSFVATLNPTYSVLAPEKWQKTVDFSGFQGILSDVLMFTHKNGIHKVWVTVKNQKNLQIWAYDFISAIWSDGPIVSSEADFLSDMEGNLWIIEPLHEKPSSLYKFDTSAMQLEPLSEQNDLFVKHNILEAKFAPDGTLWLILMNASKPDQLYAYDPNTSVLTEHLTPKEYIGLELDSSGIVYVFLTDGEIKRYDPLSLKYESYSISWDNGPLHAPSVGTLITENNVLWISDVVKFRVSEDGLKDQQVIFRSPVFLNRYFSGYQPLLWERPKPLTDTENGRVWFGSSRGLAWHQPETGEWCMFTTAESNIVKDNDGNLWLVYDNALYMLPANETQAKDD